MGIKEGNFLSAYHIQENCLSEVVVMMLMMNDEVVVEKVESVEKERSALAREIEFRLTPYLYQLAIPPHVTGYCLSLIHI